MVLYRKCLQPLTVFDTVTLLSCIYRQHCRLTICIELVELTNSVSDDKIQITILILRRGALSTQTPRSRTRRAKTLELWRGPLPSCQGTTTQTRLTPASTERSTRCCARKSPKGWTPSTLSSRARTEWYPTWQQKKYCAELFAHRNCSKICLLH